MVSSSRVVVLLVVVGSRRQVVWCGPRGTGRGGRDGRCECVGTIGVSAAGPDIEDMERRRPDEEDELGDGGG